MTGFRDLKLMLDELDHLYSEKTLQDLGKVIRTLPTIDEDERSPLHKAKTAETAKLLVEKGANVDRINKAGETPLHLCCEWVTKSCKAAPQYGASCDIRNKEGQTSCEVAIAKGYVYIAAQFPHYFPSVLSSTESGFKQEFEVLSGIGEGGYGKVYKVKKKTDGKDYALKCVTISGNSEKMQRSLREVRAAMQLGVVYKVKKKTDGKEYALKCVTISGDSEKMQRSLREVRAAMQLGGYHIVKCYDAWIEVAEDDEKERNNYYSKSSTTSWSEIMERRKRWEENRKLQEGGQKSQEGIEKTEEVNPETERTESRGGQQVMKLKHTV
ncbi:unnamed protein product [Cyprideis torosa]|uniref:Protein kinase domain-containing protein n=1 Tax=Cyprideis torosa TaxID=163714 RepID=A0A7R8WT24_9CRUS|nr:unnamed protein product [Cyprideis torosa]CAG0904389.1 unnamed protein product [Cyprideis torosa]